VVASFHQHLAFHKIKEVQKIKKDTKAISPIFATLVILAVVTVLFIPVFMWATGTTSETEDSWQLSGLIATERIVVEEVSLKAGDPGCKIYVRNIGKTTVSIEHVIISLSEGIGPLHVYSKSGTPITFTPDPESAIQGDLVTIGFNSGLVPTSNVTYTVKVITSRGISDTYQVVT
jgi:flagellin-like protein